MIFEKILLSYQLRYSKSVSKVQEDRKTPEAVILTDKVVYCDL